VRKIGNCLNNALEFDNPQLVQQQREDNRQRETENQIGEFVLRNDDTADYSERYTEKHILIKAYNHDISVTLNDMPDLKNYPLR
jgi:hypothetical protein